MLFWHAGERYELVSSAGIASPGPCFIPAGGALERLLIRCNVPVAVEWLGGTAYLLGEPLTLQESSALAALEVDFVLGLHGGCGLGGFLCIAARNGAGSDCEMQLAREVQQRTLPTQRPHIAGLDYHSDWRPAHGLSGDYLDYFVLPGGELGLAIGDVAGKGLAAALLTASLHSTARALRHSHFGNLAGLASAIDELVCEIAPDNSYATLFLARYNPSRGLLHYVNAGHEPPLVLRKTATDYRPLTLEPTGPVIGMMRKAAFRERVVSLGPGDMLVAFTDGLCDTASPRGEEWGFRRLLDTIRASSYRSAPDIVERVMEAAAAFAAGCPQYDDMTLWLGRVADSRTRTISLVESDELLAVA